jgi:hypothetical protein
MQFFLKTHLELCHTIEHLYMLWLVGIGMLTKIEIFLGFGSFPSLKSMNSMIILQNSMNAHLFGFKLIYRKLSILLKHNLSLNECPCHNT